MEIISSKLNIDFLRLRWISSGLSLLIALGCVWIWIDKGTDKYGVDFVGGTELWLRFETPTKVGDIRQALEKAGITGAVVQRFDEETNDFSIRAKTSHGAETAKKIVATLSDLGAGKIEIRKQDFVGPIIGEQIRTDGVKAIIISLICILAYVSFRFEWRFAIGAIVALVHDVWITAGLFVLLGGEISAAVLAALLTIIGYSLNDTIIIFDRVRENLADAYKRSSGNKNKKQGQGEDSLVAIFNTSINQTLSRTILTSLTTLFIALVLWLFGGGAVADLAFTLVIGLVAGTYSTVFIASPVVVALAPKDSRIAISAPGQEE